MLVGDESGAVGPVGATAQPRTPNAAPVVRSVVHACSACPTPLATVAYLHHGRRAAHQDEAVVAGGRHVLLQQVLGDVAGAAKMAKRTAEKRTAG